MNFDGFCILVWGKSSILKSDWKTYDGGDTVGSECTGSGKPLQEVGAIRGLRPPINLHQPTVQCNPPINEHPPPWDYTAICSPLATCVVVDFEKFFGESYSEFYKCIFQITFQVDFHEFFLEIPLWGSHWMDVLPRICNNPRAPHGCDHCSKLV